MLCYLHAVFCIGTNFWNQLWWNAWYSHRVSHTCEIWRHWSENTSQLIPFSLKTTSIITEILIGPLKYLIGSCTDLNVDSGSNLTYWLRHLLRLRPKIQTPAGVHSGTPAPWSSLTPLALTQKREQNTSYLQLGGLIIWFTVVKTIFAQHLNICSPKLGEWRCLLPPPGYTLSNCYWCCVILILLLQLETSRQLTLARNTNLAWLMKSANGRKMRTYWLLDHSACII